MGQIIYRIPSKVPYGYVEIHSTQDEAPIPEALAEHYVDFFNRYRKAEEAALTAPNSAPPKSRPAVTQSVDDVLMDYNGDGPGDVDAAAADLIKSTLGATEVDGDEDAPWNNKPDVETKDYESKVSDDDWSF